jgi:hypothetical protein
MQELVRRVSEALEKPWENKTGRPKSLGMYKAVEVACMYMVAYASVPCDSRGVHKTE